MNKPYLILASLLLTSGVAACSGSSEDSTGIETSSEVLTAEEARLAAAQAEIAAEAAEAKADAAKALAKNPENPELKAKLEARDRAAAELTLATNKALSNDSPWLGFGFGVGASLTFDFSNDDQIGKVTVDANNIVRAQPEKS